MNISFSVFSLAVRLEGISNGGNEGRRNEGERRRILFFIISKDVIKIAVPIRKFSQHSLTFFLRYGSEVKEGAGTRGESGLATPASLCPVSPLCNMIVQSLHPLPILFRSGYILMAFASLRKEYDPRNHREKVT